MAQTLIRTAGEITVNPVNALTLAILAEPMQNVTIKVDADNVATSAGSGDTAGLTMVDTMTDVANAAVYPLVGATQTFSQHTVSGRKLLTSQGQLSAGRRGHRLPVAAVQNKAALTIAAVVKLPTAVSGQNETLIGSSADGSAAALLQLRRASSTGALAFNARRTSVTGTNNQIVLNSLADNTWWGIIAQVDYAGGRMRLATVRATAAADEDSGWQARFAGDLGNSGTVSGQGLAIGALAGASDAVTWDATKFRGSFTRLAMMDGIISETPFSGTPITRRAVLIDRLRAEVNVLNALGA